MSGIKKRKFKCTGCGEDRPCIIEVNQEINEAFDYMLVDDLKCVLDETNQTSFNWEEVEANGVTTGEKQCNSPVVSKFNFEEFRDYVDTYDPKKHGLNKPDTIVKDLLYGIGISIDKKFSCFDGFKKFIGFIKANF